MLTVAHLGLEVAAACARPRHCDFYQSSPVSCSEHISTLKINGPPSLQCYDTAFRTRQSGIPADRTVQIIASSHKTIRRSAASLTARAHRTVSNPLQLPLFKHLKQIIINKSHILSYISYWLFCRIWKTLVTFHLIRKI